MTISKKYGTALKRTFFHPYRIVSCNSNYCDSGIDAAAGSAAGAGKRAGGNMCG